MKQVKHFILWAIAAFVVILLAQSAMPANRSGMSSLAPPQTHSPQATLVQFTDNMNDAYHLLMAAQEQTQQEGGWFHSPAVKVLAAQAEEATERAVRTLNLQDLPEASKQRKGLESALLLKEILDRLSLPPAAQIPDQDDVAANPQLVRWEIPGTEIAIVKGDKDRYINEYVFSPDTVKHLPEFYLEVRDFPYQPGASEGFYEFYITTAGGLLPPKWIYWLPKWSYRVYFDQTLWQWIGLAIAVLGAVAIAGLIYRWQQSKNLEPGSLTSAWAGLWFPGSLIIISQELETISDTLNITGEIDRIFLIVIETLLFTIGAWFTFLLANAIGRTIIAAPYFHEKPLEAAMVRSGFRLLGVVAAATIVYFGGEWLGIPVAPLFASLGIGSLAIGLGAKSYVENIISGISLFIDRPVKIGDFCEFGGITGTVENIGIRSVRLRTSDRKIVTVPNSNFSNSELVNHSKRDRYLLNFQLGLRLDTTCEQLNELLRKMRALLENYPSLAQARVNFVKMSNSSLDIEVFVYILTTDINEYLRIQEELLLKMMAIVKDVGTDLASTSPTLYLAGQENRAKPS
jgi:MscS family membrane protein